MSDGMALLRMLEPAVRPDGVAARAVGAAPPTTPIEARPFDSILAAARFESVTQVENEAAQRRPAGPMAALAQVDRIENSSLRRMIDTPVDTRNTPVAPRGAPEEGPLAA